MFFNIVTSPKAILRTYFILLISTFALPISAQQVKLEKPVLKDFTDQGFPRIQKADYYSLDKVYFISKIVDGLPQWYNENQFNLLIQKLRPEIKEMYFWLYLDGQVSNGGFSYFFENGYAYMIPEIKKFYQRIEEEKGLEILEKAGEWFKNRPREEVWIDLTLDNLDKAFYANKDASEQRIEDYVRANSHLYLRDENGEIFPQNFSGKLVSVDPIRKERKEVEVIDNLVMGTVKLFTLDGTPIEELNFVNGKQLGSQKYFDESGRLEREEILYASADYKDIRYFYPNGQVKTSLRDNSDGKMIGEYSRYHENGSLAFSYQLDANGNHTGPYFEYYPDGSKKVEVDHRGEEPKYINYWDESGVQQLVDGTGIFTDSYSYDGVTIRYEYQFVDFKKHGVQKEFRNGVLIDYREMSVGQLDGYFRKFYPNGKLHQEYLIKNGKVLEFQEKPLFDNPKLVAEIETQELESFLIQKEYELSDQYPRLLNKNEVLPLVSLSKEVFGEYGWDITMFGSYLLHVDQNGKVVGHDFFSSTNDSIARSAEKIFPQLKGMKNGFPVKSYIWFKVRVWLEEQTSN